MLHILWLLPKKQNTLNMNKEKFVCVLHCLRFIEEMPTYRKISEDKKKKILYGIVESGNNPNFKPKEAVTILLDRTSNFSYDKSSETLKFESNSTCWSLLIANISIEVTAKFGPLVDKNYKEHVNFDVGILINRGGLQFQGQYEGRNDGISFAMDTIFNIQSDGNIISFETLSHYCCIKQENLINLEKFLGN